MKPTVGQMMDTETHAVSADLPISNAIDVLVDKGVSGIAVLSATNEVRVLPSSARLR